MGGKFQEIFGMKESAPRVRRSSHNFGQKLSMLKWAEGPTGPRYKSLEREGVTWNTKELLTELV